MPILNGEDVARILRDNGYRGYIYGCTGNSQERDISMFLDKGANRVFVKPVNVHDMLANLFFDIEMQSMKVRDIPLSEMKNNEIGRTDEVPTALASSPRQ